MRTADMHLPAADFIWRLSARTTSHRTAKVIGLRTSQIHAFQQYRFLRKRHQMSTAVFCKNPEAEGWKRRIWQRGWLIYKISTATRAITDPWCGFRWRREAESIALPSSLFKISEHAYSMFGSTTVAPGALFSIACYKHFNFNTIITLY